MKQTILAAVMTAAFFGAAPLYAAQTVQLEDCGKKADAFAFMVDASGSMMQTVGEAKEKARGEYNDLIASGQYKTRDIPVPPANEAVDDMRRIELAKAVSLKIAAMIPPQADMASGLYAIAPYAELVALEKRNNEDFSRAVDDKLNTNLEVFGRPTWMGERAFKRLSTKVEGVQNIVLITDGDFDLRHALTNGEFRDEFAHRDEHVGDVLRKNLAALHVADVGARLFMKAHEDASLLGDVAHGEAGAVAVVPGRTVDRGNDRFGADLADVPERVEKDLFLVGDLSAGFEVLHGAAAAASRTVAEGGAGGLHALHGLAVNGRDAAHFKRRFVAKALVGDVLTGERSLNEDDLAVSTGDAPTFLVEAFDVDGEVFGRFLLASGHLTFLHCHRTVPKARTKFERSEL